MYRKCLIGLTKSGTNIPSKKTGKEPSQNLAKEQALKRLQLNETTKPIQQVVKASYAKGTDDHPAATEKLKTAIPSKPVTPAPLSQPDRPAHPFFGAYFNFPGVPVHDTENSRAKAEVGSSILPSQNSRKPIGFSCASETDARGIIEYEKHYAYPQGLQRRWHHFAEFARESPKMAFRQLAIRLIQGGITGYALYYVYRRYFGDGYIRTVSETDGISYLLDPRNPVDSIHVHTTQREAIVYLPHTAHPATSHFRFHLTTLSHLESFLLATSGPPSLTVDHNARWSPLSSLTGVLSSLFRPFRGEAQTPPSPSQRLQPTSPTNITHKNMNHDHNHTSTSSHPDPHHPQRPLYYSYTVGFPWTPLLLLAFLPLLAVLHTRFRLARSALSAKPLSLFGAPARGTKANGEHFFKLIKERPRTRFGEIAGMAEPKHEVREVVEFLAHPQRFARLGATVPKGIMLSGVPGVGKTLLAKAVAGEARVNFISCAGSEFVEIFVGVGASRVRDLFVAAREAAPCVVFIDEIDAFAKSRRMAHKGGMGQSEGDNTVNALLSEMDGFHSHAGVVVIAGTNRVDILDEALLRPGRFDRRVHIDPPPYPDRVEIFKVHLKPLKLTAGSAEAVDGTAKKLASLTPGNTGADIKNICNEAAIIAARESKTSVDMESFQKGMERVQIGLKRQSRVLTPSEKKRLAFHEAGHAVVNWHLRHVDPVCKVSIVQYGGDRTSVNQKLPHEKYIQTQAELEERICDMLGGVASEEYFLSELSSSAAEDMNRATGLAYQCVVRYGMCPGEVGHFSYPESQDQVAVQKPYGSVVERAVDGAVAQWVSRARDQARALIESHESQVRALQGLLMEKETLSAVDLILVMGHREQTSSELREYLTS